jgi:hypothetical protein
MDILGISCTGPEAQCERIQIKCTDCGAESVDEDDLDRLIAAVEDGDLDFTGGVCDEATFYPEEPDTNIIFVGGIFLPPSNNNTSGRSPAPISTAPSTTYGRIKYSCTNIEVNEGSQAIFTVVRSGSITVSSSLSFSVLDGTAVAGSDYDVVTTGSTLTFAPSETTKQVVVDTYRDSTNESDEKFFLQITNAVIPAGHNTSFPEGTTFECLIKKIPAIPSIATTVVIPPPTLNVNPVYGSAVVNSPVPNVATILTPVPTPDDDQLNPQYAVVADKYSVGEGETITYTITARNVSDGTQLNYTLSGNNISSDDIVGQNLTGTFEVNSESSEVKITIREDSSFEESELLRFTIDNTNAFADVVIRGETEVEPTPDPTLIPSYSVVSDKEFYIEGENIIYTITTENVPNETVLSYSLFGANITPNDFVLRSLTGTLTIKENKAIVTIGIEQDTEIEGDEIVTFVVNGTGATTDVTILGEVDEEIPDDDDSIEPCLTKPSAQALTDKYGKLISIQVDDRGCPYVVPPKVIITGNGYGAAAIPLLDEDGYVSEIRLTRTGLNYKQNVPTGLNCIIDSFTMLRPGSGYTSEPTVYVNGLENIAKAKIENGFIISIEVIDRTISFTELPSIKIAGGGGRGAKFLPNLACLPVEELEARGYAKIGTGKYIDCP